MVRRVPILAVASLAAALGASGAAARSYRVGPDPCPLRADAAPYAAPRDVAATPDSVEAVSFPLAIVDAPLDAPPPGPLFARFVFLPRAIAEPADKLCPP